jgi:hypothetical protein
MQRFNNPILHAALLVVIAFLVYAHTFDAGFMFDDYAQQEMLKLISRGEREVNIFNFVTTPEEATYYTQMTAVPWWTNTSWRIRYFRPVASFSHLFDYTFWKSNPLPYHVHNVALYALLVVLLYVLYAAFFRHAWAALCGALIFTLEPCHYMTVRWIASRNDIICAIFLVASLICYLRFVETRRLLQGFLFILSYILALCTKEISFIFPVLILIHDLIRFKSLKTALIQQWKVYFLLFIINVGYFLFYQANGYGSYWYGERLFRDYPADFVKATGLYLAALFYGGVIASVGPDFVTRYWYVLALQFLVAAYITYLIWKQRDRFPEVSLFIAWMVLPLPFIVVPPLNDRLLLIPSIGYAYLAALAILMLKRKWLAWFFLIIALILPPFTNIIQARQFDKVMQSEYEAFYNALDEIIPHKTTGDRLFLLNFPRQGVAEMGLAGENYMYLGLYYALYYRYPEWQVTHPPLSAFNHDLAAAVRSVSQTGMKLYPLSAFDDPVSVEVLDAQRLRISHPDGYYFETNTERLFSLNRTFQKGETFNLPDLTITLDNVESGRVKSIVVQSALPLDNPSYFFLYYDSGRWQQWHPLSTPPPFPIR